MMLSVDKSQCVYTSCFCEENVWKLCERVQLKDPQFLEACYAVFVSNASRLVPLWMQSAGRGDEKRIIWDYHVIFVFAKNKEEQYVYDLDSALTPFPHPFDDYVKETFRSDDIIISKYHRKFRIIPAKLFLSTFASDRSHMKNESGDYVQSPPTYPCIQTKDSTNNIQDFISMDSRTGVGKVVGLPDFIDYFKSAR